MNRLVQLFPRSNYIKVDSSALDDLFKCGVNSGCMKCECYVD
jgi:hypothetical protein